VVVAVDVDELVDVEVLVVVQVLDVLVDVLVVQLWP
jgi:hypothetical protein